MPRVSRVEDYTPKEVSAELSGDDVTERRGEMTNFTVDVVISMAVLAISCWAVSKIILQAGFSAWWILVPLAPTLLTIACLAELWNDVHDLLYGGAFGFTGIENVGTTWKADEVAILIFWLLSLVFAASRWPVWMSHHSSPVTAANVGTHPTVRAGTIGSIPVPAPVAPRAAERADLPRSGEGAVRTTETPAQYAATPGADTLAVPHCRWCGEGLPGSRITFHNCGPKDRPAAFCTKCGTALVAGSPTCPSCGST
jgi:hypothetical protein